jgi:hypothetical protein
VAYSAVAGDKHSHGSSAGAALEALTAQLPEEATGTMVIIQSRRPDEYFNTDQQQRLAQLMGAWRTAQETGAPWSAAEQAELEALIETELRASAASTAAPADELNR